LLRSQGSRSLWAALADSLCELPAVDTVAVFVADQTGGSLIGRYVSGAHGQFVERLSIPVGERMSGWVAASGQSMINADAALDLFDVQQARPLRSALAIPCRGPDGACAVVALYSTSEHAFTPLHQRLAEVAVASVEEKGTTTRVVHIRPDRLSSGRHESVA
jgi:GAF domain-containing protein